jgi:predicted transposase YdaD
MATPFDATTKELVRLHPEDWLELLGLPPASCELMDADLATVSTEADRLIRVLTQEPYLVHIEFQAGHDGHKVPGRMLRYNVLAGEQTEHIVLSYVILLRPEADSPALTGSVVRRRPNGSSYLHFEYEILRLWQVPVSHVLRGGVSTLPLALLCDLSETSPERVVESLEARIETEAVIENRRKLWASTYLLAGIRYAPEIAGKLLEKAVAQMKESMTYQKILADGRQEGIAQGIAEGRSLGIAQGVAQGERELLLLLGTDRFGPPDASLHEVLEKAQEPQLRAWARRLFHATSWAELLTLPES